MPSGLVTISYLVAAVLFILALGGLSQQETARRGNLYGLAGMSLALIVTVLGVVTANYAVLFGGMAIGGAIGLVLARRVRMTQMPELVAVLHSLVGLAAVLVGVANFLDRSVPLVGVERTIHGIETWLGVLIGAVTLSGSLVAFGKLSGKIGGKPLMLPARHWLNLGLLVLAVGAGKVFLDQSATPGGGLTQPAPVRKSQPVANSMAGRSASNAIRA